MYTYVHMYIRDAKRQEGKKAGRREGRQDRGNRCWKARRTEGRKARK
jgi:hypothetical protein